MDWIALKHVLLSHLPVAVGLLLPWPLLTAQRPGRGIRPWWTVARYLGWMGLLGTLGALVSGMATGHLLALIPPHRILPVAAFDGGAQALLYRHALYATGSLLVGIVAIWSLNRPRKDHQSLGFLTLVLGLAWSALLLLTGEGGYRLAHGQVRTAVPQVVPAVTPPATLPAALQPHLALDPESKAPVRALDYTSLVAIHSDPVKSPAHGGRWIRVWCSPEAVAAYRAGESLPQGALVVVSSVEDRYGRPGTDVGPLYALEMKPSGPALTFYWAGIPMDRRRDFGGESKVYWRSDDAHLEACRTCHATGMAEASKRSRWRLKRLPVESSAQPG